MDFAIFSYFSLILFTKGVAKPTPQKKKRNIVYKVCGYIMLACILLIFLNFLIKPQLGDLKPVFCLETIALWAFGISWLTKGEFLLKDV